MTWTVHNGGIGTTDSDAWGDRIYLRNVDTNAIYELGTFTHIGRISPTLGYSRSVDVVVPNGLSGTFQLVVRAAHGSGPYEFIYNTTESNSLAREIEIGLSDSPDLRVTSIEAPASALEGEFIDVSWTISNSGLGDAEGTWTDKIELKRLDDPSAPLIRLGEVTYDQGLNSGNNYSRTERFQLPPRKPGVYAVLITTNNRTPRLYEYGTVAQNNNSTLDDQVINVGMRDRPDLRVENVQLEDGYNAGGTASISFTVRNHGTVAANGQWRDRVYLSLDAQLTADDIPVDIPNGSALAPGAFYNSSVSNIRIPIRFANSAYLLVVPDGVNTIDEYPNDNNVYAARFNVNPVPLSDLVTDSVVAPSQGVYGANIEVRYQVTNRGSAATDVSHLARLHLADEGSHAPQHVKGRYPAGHVHA